MGVIEKNRVPVLQPAAPVAGEREEPWLPPGGYASANAWALENRQALDNYAAHVARHGTAAQQLHQYLEAAGDAVA